MINKDTILEFLKFFRPKFYNKITWFLVVSGVGILSKPLWLDIFNSLLETSIQISITDNCDLYIGLVIIAMALIYHVIFHTKTTNVNHELADIKEHDRKIFSRASKILDYTFLDEFTDDLIGDHSASLYDQLKLEKYKYFLSNPSNEFLIESVNKKSEDLVNCISKLLTFMLDNFDKFPYEQINSDYRICLAPRLNIDRMGSGNPDEERKYVKLSGELRALGFQLLDCYKTFSKEVKKKLQV
jgi:hypothetical protein